MICVNHGKPGKEAGPNAEHLPRKRDPFLLSLLHPSLCPTDHDSYPRLTARGPRLGAAAGCCPWP